MQNRLRHAGAHTGFSPGAKVLVSLRSAGVMLAVAAGALGLQACSFTDGSETRLAPPSKLGAGLADMRCRASIETTRTATDASEQAMLRAHHQAIEAWRIAAVEKHGEEFGHWWRATARTIACKPSGATVVCRVAAAPCMGAASEHAQR